MEKVYGFTNENLSSFPEIFNFSNAYVLTVLGSGDQYFSSLLNGAKDIDVFDINYLAWYHFILKYSAIKVLSYEEFMQMFVSDGLDNLSIYAKLRKYLPDEVKYFFDKLISLGRTFSSIKIKNIIFDNAKIKNIPYFNENTYYKLQSLLIGRNIPTFYNCNLLDIPKFTKKSYDVTLLSNIYHYLGMSASSYKEFLDKVNSPEILALYTWILNSEEGHEFLNSGFDIHEVPGVLHKSDYIVSLSRKKQ